MNQPIKRWIRQGFKCIFWPITFPILAVVLAIVAIVAPIIWAFDEDDNEALGAFMGTELRLFIRDGRFLVLN